MEDRLRALCGSLRVQSAPRQGTRVTGELPVEPTLESAPPQTSTRRSITARA
jgi:hypothetical protein